MKLRHWTAVPILLASLLGAGAAAAQDGGYALNRFNPSDRGSDWFSVESLDFDGELGVALGVVGDWAYKPLVLYDANGDELSSIVEHQVFAHAGLSLTLWNRLKLGVSVPLVAVNSTEEGTQTNSSFSSEEGTGIGDVRAGLDIRLIGAANGPFRLGIGGSVFFPTGDPASYTGEDAIRIQPRLGVAGDIGPIAYAASVNSNIRTEDTELDGQAMGTELGFSGAVGVKLVDDKLLLGPEIYGTTAVGNSDDFLAERTTPFEVVLGAHYDITENWVVGAGVGPGLTRGFGSPALRVLASLEYRGKAEKEEPAPPPPPDTDGDGIIDEVDACPNERGVPNDDPTKHGCPPPGDRDNDGILDEVDACPDSPGVANEDPTKHGCPPPKDSDGDGVADDVDACPNERGVANEDPTKHGCPLPKDSDGDGILDDVDACPNVIGLANEDPKKHGCPKAQIQDNQIKILEQVKFKHNSDVILPESDSLLEAVKKVLDENPDIEVISVEGHTDSTGAAAYNRNLSRRRAASVVKWLTSRGVAANRLTSQGFGPDKPIDTNETDLGRQNNRRVEFHIIKVKEGSSLKVEKR